MIPSEKCNKFEYFCWQVQSLLESGCIVKSSPQELVIEGGIILRDSIPRKISITISSTWETHCPQVRCREKWMKEGVDWHINDDGTLCYVLANHWADAVNELNTKLPVLCFIEISAQWMVDCIQWLMDAHLYAHQLDMENWPRGWDSWPHYDKGVQKYQKLYRNKAAVEQINYPASSMQK
jgi:hypothetical protein